jgi:hypothetical protein
MELGSSSAQRRSGSATLPVFEVKKEVSANRKRFTWGGFLGGIVAIVTLVGGMLGIKQYYDQNPPYHITGTWIIENKIEQTSYSPFKNLQLTYTVQFTQNGPSLTGSGEKTMEAGHEIAGHAHTPIQITGNFAGDSIDASYAEDGVKRQSHGEFHWKLAKGGSWVGTFHSTAADSAGSSVLRASGTP